jgi:hypothetical protein
MNESDDAVECPEHGLRDATYVCQHLSSGMGAGFHCGHDADDPDRLWPDAWCDQCERVRQSEGEWNERSEAFAGIHLLCDGCYQRIRARNWRQDEAAFDELLREAVTYLQARQDQLYAQYSIGSYPRYDWNPETGQLIFSENGRPRVVADIQFIGSISTRSSTWLWSWANRSILETVKRRIRDVRAYGEERRYLKLASACWAAEEADGWEMTAVAAYLLKAPGAYRSPGPRGFSFLVMTDVQWAH